jgi:hypothetical protein
MFTVPMFAMDVPKNKKRPPGALKDSGNAVNRASTEKTTS